MTLFSVKCGIPFTFADDSGMANPPVYIRVKNGSFEKILPQDDRTYYVGLDIGVVLSYNNFGAMKKTIKIVG